MNLSGQAVQAAAKFFKLVPEDVLVICDDLNLAPGQLRLRAAGSAGGQKGLGDIILRLGTDAVPRLRVGIGRPIPPQDAVSYVLGRIAGGERRVMDEAVLRAADAVECWATDGLETAMNRFNAGMT
jgi:PTH1 family peptidyl-tRNA hydrolase